MAHKLPCPNNQSAYAYKYYIRVSKFRELSAVGDDVIYSTTLGTINDVVSQPLTGPLCSNFAHPGHKQILTIYMVFQTSSEDHTPHFLGVSFND